MTAGPDRQDPTAGSDRRVNPHRPAEGPRGRRMLPGDTRSAIQSWPVRRISPPDPSVSPPRMTAAPLPPVSSSLGGNAGTPVGMPAVTVHAASREDSGEPGGRRRLSSRSGGQRQPERSRREVRPASVRSLLFLGRAVFALTLAVAAGAGNAWETTPEDHALRAAREAYAGKRFDLALDLVLPLAVAGDPRAQHFLGTLYLSGTGLGRDPEQATQWLRRSALQGHAPAEYSLGYLFATGDGVARDLDEARRWLEAAAANGHELAPAALRHLERLMPPEDDEPAGDDPAPVDVPEPSHLIQLLAVGSREQAEQGWEDLRRRFPRLLGSLNPVIVLARDGRLHRLRAGPFDSLSAARDACAALAPAPCFPVPP